MVYHFFSKMITVICPCYNAEKYIDKTIASLLDQVSVNFKFEIIFVDDGSTDNTLELLNNSKQLFNAKDIKTKIISQDNYGAGAARNKGIKSASFEYLAFLDADDIWVKTKLQVCHDFIIKNKESNLFSHNEKYIKLNGNNILLKNGRFKYESISKSLYLRNSLSTSAVIVKKSLLIDHGYFDTSLKSSQDYDLWLKLSPHMKACNIEITLGEYHEIENSITSKYYLFRFFDQLIIAYRYRKYVNFASFLKKILKILASKQWVLGLFNFKKHGF